MKKIYGLLMVILIFVFVGCNNDKLEKVNKTKELPKRMSFIEYDKGYKFGKEDAPIIMVEYSSYECSDCEKLHNNIEGILKKYIEEGKLLYIYKPVDHPKFKNDESINKYFEPETIDDLNNIYKKFNDYHNKSYEEVKKVLNLSDKLVEKYDEINSAVEKELKDGKIKGTPIFYINDKEYQDVYTKENFEKLLNESKINKSE